MVETFCLNKIIIIYYYIVFTLLGDVVKGMNLYLVSLQRCINIGEVFTMDDALLLCYHTAITSTAVAPSICPAILLPPLCRASSPIAPPYCCSLPNAAPSLMLLLPIAATYPVAATYPAATM